jgi:hypothetical protein
MHITERECHLFQVGLLPTYSLAIIVLRSIIAAACFAPHRTRLCDSQPLGLRWRMGLVHPSLRLLCSWWETVGQVQQLLLQRHERLRSQPDTFTRAVSVPFPRCDRSKVAHGPAKPNQISIAGRHCAESARLRARQRLTGRFGKRYRPRVRFDAEADSKNGLQLIDRVRLWKKGGALDEQGLHSIRDRVARRVEHAQVRLLLNGFLRQTQARLHVTLQFDVGEQNVDVIRVDENRRCFIGGGRRKRLMALFLEKRL